MFDITACDNKMILIYFDVCIYINVYIYTY